MNDSSLIEELSEIGCQLKRIADVLEPKEQEEIRTNNDYTDGIEKGFKLGKEEVYKIIKRHKQECDNPDGCCLFGGEFNE